MRKFLAFLLVVGISLSLTACSEPEPIQDEASSTTLVTIPNEDESLESDAGQSEETEIESESAQESSVAENQSKILVAYFSWADNAILAEDVDAVASPSVVAPGNVQELAGWVQEETGGDLFAIRVTEAYPSDWDSCLARANEEQGNDARPALEDQVENLDQYDTVFLGYPNWWYGVPMALLTFLEENDLSGKDVYLFCSHGTGGLARSVEIITEAAPGASISDNIFDCYEEEASDSQSDIQDWVNELGY